MQDVDELISENISLAYHMLKKFHLTMDQDAESLALEALMKAAITYDGSSSKFCTYAYTCIYNALGCHVRTLKKKPEISIVSYNAVAYTDDGGNHEHLEFIPSPFTADSTTMRNDLICEVKKQVKLLYDKMPDSKQKDILKIYINSEYSAQSQEIADKVGVSQSYASQVLTIFKGKLRKKMEEYYYD